MVDWERLLEASLQAGTLMLASIIFSLLVVLAMAAAILVHTVVYVGLLIVAYIALTKVFYSRSE